MNKDVIFVRIDEDLKKKLDMIALNEQRSLNNLVVKVLTQFVEETENKSKPKERKLEHV